MTIAPRIENVELVLVKPPITDVNTRLVMHNVGDDSGGGDIHLSIEGTRACTAWTSKARGWHLSFESQNLVVFPPERRLLHGILAPTGKCYSLAESGQLFWFEQLRLIRHQNFAASRVEKSRRLEPLSSTSIAAKREPIPIPATMSKKSAIGVRIVGFPTNLLLEMGQCA